MSAMLEVVGLDTCYGRTQVLWDIGFSVAEGRTVALIGSNGAGKTTVLNTICGILRPRKGQVIFEGKPITDIPAHHLVGMGLVQVPEGRELFSRMTVMENLELAAYARRDGAVDKDIRGVLERFPVLGKRRLQISGTLSGGEQQMLAIARGLIARPRLLLLDEPSWGLAPMVIDAVFDTIKAIQAEGTTILLVEQNATQALAVADEAYVLEHGRIVLGGTAESVAMNDEVTRVYLGGFNPRGQ